MLDGIILTSKEFGWTVFLSYFLYFLPFYYWKRKFRKNIQNNCMRVSSPITTRNTFSKSMSTNYICIKIRHNNWLYPLPLPVIFKFPSTTPAPPALQCLIWELVFSHRVRERERELDSVKDLRSIVPIDQKYKIQGKSGWVLKSI